MPARWFRVPKATIQHGDAERTVPDLRGHDVAAKSGNRKGGPKWIVHVRADESTLDALAEEPGITEFEDVPGQALNNMVGQERDKQGWKRGFRVGQR